MNRKRALFFILLLVLVPVLLAACAPAAPGGNDLNAANNQPFDDTLHGGQGGVGSRSVPGENDNLPEGKAPGSGNGNEGPGGFGGGMAFALPKE